MDGGVGEVLRIEVAAFGQTKDDFRELETGGFYGFGTTADAWRDLRPSIIESL